MDSPVSILYSGIWHATKMRSAGRYGALRQQPDESDDHEASLLDCMVTDVPARELRNDVSGVLRRVEAGERVRVTVSGRPVAELIPLPSRPWSRPWKEFMQDSEQWRADADLDRDLRALLPDTTDDDLVG